MPICIEKCMYIEAKNKTITLRPIEIVLQDKLYLQSDTKTCLGVFYLFIFFTKYESQNKTCPLNMYGVVLKLQYITDAEDS